MKSLEKFKTKNSMIIIVFALVFLFYIINIIVNYVNKPKIFAYQVKEGSLAENNTYTGFIIRDEKIFYTADTGYIDYFARESEHVGVGDLVYTIDESGAIEELINDNLGENSLSNEDLKELKLESQDFIQAFDAKNYSRTYDYKYSINGLVLKFANMNILEKLDDANSKALSDVVKLCNAQETGYVVYNIDGYESISVNAINKDCFDKSSYEKEQLVSNTIVDAGSPAYKLIQSEKWSVIVPLSWEKAKSFEETDYVDIKFLENQNEVTAAIEITKIEDDYYAILTMSTGVLNYCNERYIDIEILGKSQTGLKIPVSSIVKKSFYLIPEEFAVEKAEENKYYFLKKVFREDGTVTAELVSVEIYANIDGIFYVDTSALRPEDYLIKKDSSSETPVYKKGELVGVYNINKGYADFRQIQILYQNDEYAIVKKNTNYGLNVYDYIVLDSSSVKEEEIIY